MATLTFTVGAVYDVKDGFKTGSIKTDTGKYISFWPSDKGLFSEGCTYSAVCDEFTKKDGTVAYTVKSPGKGGNVSQTGGTAAPVQTPTIGVVLERGGIGKDEMISRLAIAKSCIESNQSQADADSWMAWVMKEPAPELGAPESPQQLETDVFAQGGDSVPF